MAFGDVLAGLAEASHQHHTNLLQLDYQKRQKLAEAYGKLAEDESYPEEQRSESLKRALTLHTLPLGKKIPKEFESFSFTVKPRSAPAQDQFGLKAGGSALTGEKPSGVSQEDQGPWMNQGPAFDIAAPPVAPPEMRQHQQAFGPMPFDERMDRLTKESIAKSAGSQEIAQMKAMIPEKVGQYTKVNENGERISVIRYRIPGTGQTFEQEAEDPQAYAYRGGSLLDVDDFGRLQAAGVTNPVFNPSQEIIQKIQQAAPGVELRADAANPGYYYITSSPNKFQNIGSRVVATQGIAPGAQPLAGAVDVGQAPSTLTKTNVAPMILGVDESTGRVYVRDTARTTTTQQTGATGVPFAGSQATAPTPPAGRLRPLAPGEVLPGYDPAVLDAIQKKIGEVDLKGMGIDLQLIPQGQPQVQPAPAAKPAGTVAAPTEPPGPQAQVMPPADPAIRPYQSAYLQQPYAQPFARESAATAGGPAPDTGMAPGILGKEREMLLSIAPAAQMLFGDPNNPMFESLESFAPLMDDEQSRKNVGETFRLIKEGLSTIHRTGGEGVAFNLLKSFGASASGDLMGIVKNFLGMPQWIAAAEVAPIEKQMQRLSDTEARMVARLIASYGTIVGIRKITSGGAYQFSTDAMEREIPVPGVTGIKDMRSYLNKLAQLAEEIATPAELMYMMKRDPQMVALKESYKKSAIRLSIKGRATRVANAPGQPPLYLVNNRWYDEQGNPR